MKTLSTTARRRMTTLGYEGIPDRVLARIEPWFRSVGWVNLVWAGVGTALGSGWILGALAAFLVWGSFRRAYPLDLLVNTWITRGGWGFTMPPSPGPRRFGFGLLAIVVALAATAFALSLARLGTVLGAVSIAVPGVYLVTGHCATARIYTAFIGPVRRYRVE